MFCALNRFRTEGRRRIREAFNSRGGQVAVLLIIVIAIGLVFFAASINLTLVSQAKTLTMKAATNAASNMASFISSNGQKQYKETLGGEVQKCKTSGGGITAVITIFVFIMIAIFAGPLATALGNVVSATQIATAALTAAAMEGASALMAAGVDPGISSYWNSMMDTNLSTIGQGVEHGLQAAIQTVQTDPVKIPDLYDLDQDGAFGYRPGATVDNIRSGIEKPNDTISRFALYNTKRFLALTGPDATKIQEFEDALHELIVAGGDGWGLIDPVKYPGNNQLANTMPDGNLPNPNTNFTNGQPVNLCRLPLSDANSGWIPAECDPCCTNWTVVDAGAEIHCNGSGATPIGDRSRCVSRTPFRADGNLYPWVYDSSYEDSTNPFMSFREQLGRDDEHSLYHVPFNAATMAAEPNWHWDPVHNPQNVDLIAANKGFYLKDAVGNYTNPPFGVPPVGAITSVSPTTGPDIWIQTYPPSDTGKTTLRSAVLFPFLYKMSDWGAELKNVTYSDYECYLCDQRSLKVCPGDISSYAEISNRLVLTSDPSTVPYNKRQGWCVNKDNSLTGNPVATVNDPPLLSDVVRGLSRSSPGHPGLLIDVDKCGLTIPAANLWDPNSYVDGWKRGSDRYCSHAPRDGVMYHLACPKNGAGDDPEPDGLGFDAQCGQLGAQAPQSFQALLGAGDPKSSNWPDDWIDQIIYGMKDLLDIESFLWPAMQIPYNRAKVAQNFTNGLYPPPSQGQDFANGLGDWIEPGCQDPDNCPGSFTKLTRPGTLYRWRAELQFLNKEIQNWIVPASGNPVYSAQPGTGNNNHFGPDAVWCLPSPVMPFPGIATDPNLNIPQTEQDTFDVNANGIRGDVADVIACLDWNVSDVQTYPHVLGVLGDKATGNEEKFQACLNQCDTKTCDGVLPRSLTPRFYDTNLMPQFDPGDEAGRAKIVACLNGAQTFNQCATNCDPTALPSGGAYPPLPAFTPPNLGQADFVTNFCAANPPGTTADTCNNIIDPSINKTLTCGTNDSVCRCSWAGSCAAILDECINFCLNYPGACSTVYKEAVNNLRPLTQATCCVGAGCDPKYANFRDIIRESAQEAGVQVKKFRIRANFLRNRYAEAMALSYDSDVTRLKDDHFYPNLSDGILTQAIKKLTAFLDNGTPNILDDSPAEKLIQARIESTDEVTGDDLPSFIVYVWQDPDSRYLNPAGELRNGAGHGYWHAVKAEVRIPKRCAGNCINTEWPKVFSETSGGGLFQGTKICYTLINLRGKVKARVIRYDQDKDLTGLNFPGGAPIWSAKMSHPKTGDADPSGLRSTCLNQIDNDLRTWILNPADVRHSEGAAFMLNKVPDFNSNDSQDIEYRNCWVAVHKQLLAHGIQSEACAEYYFVSKGAGGQDGFRMKFVPCGSF